LHLELVVKRSISAPLAALAAAVALSATPALATVLTFFGADDPKGSLTNSSQAEKNFQATLSVYGTETFEALAPFTPDPALAFGATGITATSDVDYVAPFPPLAVSGSNLILDQGPKSANDPGLPDVFTFNQPITAFGSYFTQAGDGPANTIILLLQNTLLGTSKTVTVGTLGPNAGFDNAVFFGVTDTDAFNRVSMIESYDFDGVLLDNVTAGQVPEPSTLALLVAGLGALALVRARRGRA
jgi:hypothetical protein